MGECAARSYAINSPLGCTKLRVQELVTGAVKNGFVDEWLPLNNTDYKDKYRKQSVSGELHIEVEMGGIISDTDGTGPSASADLAIPMELQQLKDLEHRLITYKVNLKSIYSLLLEAVVLLDLCVASGKDLSKIRVKDQAWFLSREGVLILRQFSQVWTISDVFRKMKYLECVFRKYKEQRLHARVVTAAYKNLYEGIWKRGSIWLPNYEVGGVRHRLHMTMLRWVMNRSPYISNPCCFKTSRPLNGI